MKKLIFFIPILLCLFSSSCDDRMDEAPIKDQFQHHLDSLVSEGYQIDDVSIYAKSFKDHGAKANGQFDYLFIRAVSPDPSVQYMANFSLLSKSGTNQLTFHGYPNDMNNKKKNKVYKVNPNISQAIQKIDEIKSQIPEGFAYKNLLQLNYHIENDGRPIYEYRIELEPKRKDADHPNVKKEELSHLKIIRPSRSRKTGYKKPKTKMEKKTQYEITFKLENNEIKLK